MIALARVALVEITPPDTFTDVAQVTRKEGVVDVAYPCTLAGYPGWTWTITLSDLPGIDPSVLELELLPGDGALLSPPWVPWADRLEDYLVAEKELDHPRPRTTIPPMTVMTRMRMTTLTATWMVSTSTSYTSI